MQFIVEMFQSLVSELTFWVLKLNEINEAKCVSEDHFNDESPILKLKLR